MNIMDTKKNFVKRTNRYISSQLKKLSKKLWRRRQILADSKQFLNNKEKIQDFDKTITKMPNDWSDHKDFDKILNIMPKNLPNIDYNKFTLTFDAQYANNKTGRVNYNIELPNINKYNVTDIVKNIIFENVIGNPIIEEPILLPGIKKNYTEIVDEDGNVILYETFNQSFINPEYMDENTAQEISNIDFSYVGIKGIVGIQLENPNNPSDILNIPLNEFTHNYGLGEIVRVEKDCLKVTLEQMWKKNDLPEGGITIKQAIKLASELKQNIRFYNKNDKLIAEHVHSTHKPIPGIYVVDSKHIEIKTKPKKIKEEFVKDIKPYLIELFNNKNIPIVNKFDRRTLKIKSYTFEDKTITLDEYYNFREQLKVPNNQLTLNYMMDKINKNIGFDYSSAYNQQTFYTLKDITFGGIIKNFYDGKDLVAIDKNQFYTTILMNSNFEVPIFDICDQVTPFEEGDEIKPGLYLCEDGWKFHITITGTPTLKIYSSDSVNIKHIAKGFKDVPKDIINAIIGCWQKSSMFKTKVLLSGDKDDADRYKANEMARVGKLEEYDVYFTQNFEPNLKFRNHRMVVGMIIQYSHLEIMKTKLALESLGKKVYEIRTDSFLIENFDNITDEFLALHKCKKVNKKLDTIFKNQTINRKVDDCIIIDEDTEISFIETNWNEHNINDIESLITNNESFIITGEAGTGKSHIILNVLPDIMNKLNISYRKAAFTNTAASNIGGITLHELFNLDKDFNWNSKCGKLDFTYVIIDEFTQVPFKIWEYLYNSKFDNLRFIIVGDYHQLSPVQSIDYVKRRYLKNPKASDIYYREFNNMLDLRFIREFANNNIIRLNEIHRYKKDFKIKNGVLDKKSDYDIILTYSRQDANNINSILFAKFKNKFVNGVQVMNKLNKKRYRIINNQLELINSLQKEIIPLPDNFDNYIVNFANTIYSAQGQGYNKYAVLNYETLEGKNKYVVDTRRRTNIIYNISQILS